VQTITAVYYQFLKGSLHVTGQSLGMEPFTYKHISNATLLLVDYNW